jgi:hypothetical protein
LKSIAWILARDGAHTELLESNEITRLFVVASRRDHDVAALETGLAQRCDFARVGDEPPPRSRRQRRD